MAVYPCDYNAHRYVQPQQSIYVTTIVGETLDTYKLRFCPKHFDEIAQLAEDFFKNVEDDAYSAKVCDVCEAPSTALFAIKVFPMKAELRQYVGERCTQHAAEALAAMKTSPGRLMAGR